MARRVEFEHFHSVNMKLFEKTISKNETDLKAFSNALYHYWNSGKGRLKTLTLNKNQILLLMRAYRTTYPAPGSHFGLLLSMMYFEPKQQTNLNAKQVKIENKKFLKELEEKYFVLRNVKYVKEIYKITNTSIKSDSIFSNFNHKITYSVFIFYGDIYFINKVLLKLKKYCVGIRFEESNNNKHIVSIFTLKNDFYYFLIHLYSLVVKNVDMVFTSIKNLFKNNKEAFIINSTFYLYCITTGQYLPIVNCLEDEIKFNYLRLISTISYEGGCGALKNFADFGWGPLANIIFEAGIMSSKKYFKNYPDKLNRVGGIFQNTFLNKPINGSSLFQNFEFYNKEDSVSKECG